MELMIAIPDEVVHNVIKTIMENMPESSLSMDCLKWKYEELKFRFQDKEDDTIFDLDKEKLLVAFKLMFTDKWPRGLTKPPLTHDEKVWDEWLCQSDADSFDAFVQLACFGEVIYG